MRQNDPVTNGPRPALSIRRSAPQRGRVAAALAATAVLAASLLIIVDQSAIAAPPAAAAVAQAAAPVTTTATTTGSTGTTASLSVDPAGGLTTAGATLHVTGKGFNSQAGLYVAICHLNGSARPDVQTDCVGSPIPANTSKSWAHIDGSGTAVPGQASIPWQPGGSFAVDLALPASNSASDALDCSKVVCAVITTPDVAQDDPSQDLSVPITYAATPSTPTTPTTSSSTPTTSSSPATTSQQIVTSTITVVGTTVQPKTIASTSVVAGGTQEVLFAGFAKNESVSVTLYSDPIKLPDAKADSDGIVKIDFTVPATLPAGTHLLRAVGRTSKVVGIASFEVTAPVVQSTAASSAPVSSVPASSAAIAPIPVASSAAASSAAPTSRLVAVVVLPAAAKSRLVWPWYVLGVVVLLWVGLAIFLMQRRRKRLAAENLEKERILAEASLAENERAAAAQSAANSDAPTAYIGPVSSDQPEGYLGYHPGEHGLLSGRDHPDNPGMMSGRGQHPGSTGEQPTTYLPPAPGAGAAPAGGSATGAAGSDPAAGGPPTGAWTPDFAAPQRSGSPADTAPEADSGGPGTSQWQPNFDDEDDSDGPGPTGGRHSS